MKRGKDGEHEITLKESAFEIKTSRVEQMERRCFKVNSRELTKRRNIDYMKSRGRNRRDNKGTLFHPNPEAIYTHNVAFRTPLKEV